jgi:hypothetical protein
MLLTAPTARASFLPPMAPPAPGPAPLPVLPAAPASTPLRERIVAIAAGELGVREDTGNNDGARIVEYRSAVTGPGEDPLRNEPWCADFVSWTYRQAGAPLGIDGHGEDWTVAMRLWAIDAGRYAPSPWFSQVPPGTPPAVPIPPTRLTFDEPATPLVVAPAPGDVLFFDWDRDGTVQHVGIVERVADGRVETIEGNSGNMVARRSYELADPRIDGWLRAD